MRLNLFKNGVRSAPGNGILKERLNQWREMAFKVGDRVVYPHHGAAIVEEKKVKTIFGSRKEYLILRMVMDNMTVSVPVEKVDEVGMRWPISGEDVEDLFCLLYTSDAADE